MCPVVLLTLLCSLFMLLMELTAALNVTFFPSALPSNILENEYATCYYTVEGINLTKDSLYKVVSNEPGVAAIYNQSYIFSNSTQSLVNTSFVIEGKFLGITEVHVIHEKDGKVLERSTNYLKVKVLRPESGVRKAFVVCVSLMVSLNYINMGCALDMQVVKSVLKKPIAPAVGFVSQYVVMPLVAYGLAVGLFSDVVLQLGLFTFGCSPGGGASNMWTVLLRGNLNLSLTMTALSNLAAFGMMPLWLFTLGRTLFSKINLKIPYSNILYYLGAMLIALSIGLALQRYKPRIAKFCRRMLAPICLTMIVFIVIFATYAYFYVFWLFTWHIILAATINVWLGFFAGGVASKLFRLPIEDVIAIAVETGIQNTATAFILLKVSLHEPESDLASVIPIAASIVTPIPLVGIIIIQRVWNRCSGKVEASDSYVLNNDDERRALPTPTSMDSINSAQTKGYMY